MIFKNFETNETKFVELEQSISPLFSSSVHKKKTGSGWTATKNTSFTSNPSLTSSVYFVDNNSFFVSYATSSASLTPYYLNWNTLVSTISNNYSYQDEEFSLYFNNNKITEAVIISISPDNLNQGLDYDNFFLVMSGSTGNNFTDADSNGNFNVTNNLVLAPYYIKKSANDTTTASGFTVNDKFISLSPVYELRTTTSNTFLTYNSGSGAIDIDWTDGTVSSPYGVVMPEIGVIVLFPELFGRAQITTALRTEEKSLNSLRSLMFIAGYSEKKVDKQLYFLRLKPNEFNKSLNKSSYEFQGGTLEYKSEFENNPTVYITQVGLYNDYNECLAVAFMSQPTKKTSIDELPIRVEISM